MIVQLMVGNEPVTVIEGVTDYETGKHHTMFVTERGIIEVPVRSYDYFTVQLEQSDVEEVMDEHVPKSKKKRIGFVDDETDVDEGGEPLEPAIGDVVEDEEDYDWDEDEECWEGF